MARGRGEQRRDTAAAPRPHSSPHHHARSPPNISKRDFCNQGHPTLAVGGEGVGPTSAEEASLHLPSLTPPAPRSPPPQLWTDRSGAAGRAAGTMAPAPSSCVTGRAPSSESQVRRSFRTAGSLRPFSCQPWAPAPGTKGLAGPGDSLHLRGVILGPETLVSTRAFCKFASLPPRRRLDPVLGLRVVPLCLSSLRF